MTNPDRLTNPTPGELATAVEENLHGLFRTMALSLGGDLTESALLGRHYASPTNPMFKGAWGARLPAETVETAITETLAWFEEQGAPFAFWWTGPSTEPADLGERLIARGLTRWETEAGAPGMVATLSTLKTESLATVPVGFTIHVVDNDEALADFGRVFTAAYAVPEWAGQAWVDATRQMGIQQAPWRLYLGRFQGEPVATTLLFINAGVAGLYAVGTVPAVRSQGIGSAIVVKSLLDARAAGCQHAVLFATEMAVHLYGRLGFQDSGARINRYLWRNTP